MQSLLQAVSLTTSTLSNFYQNNAIAFFPSHNSTVSYWMAHNTGPSNRLAGYGREYTLPMHADVIIVGAGISGAAVAHFLINSDSPPDSVALVEGRNVASGATGRNGGFVKPVPFLAYADYKKSYGTTAALQLVQSEYDNIQLTAELVEQGAIDAGFTIRSHREILLDEATAAFHKARLDLIRSDRAALGIPQTDGVTWISNSTEARRVTRSRGAVAACTFDTGSIWPHKFVTALVANLLPSKRFRLFTHTQVNKISKLSPGEPGEPRWAVRTSRGDMTANTVILTTNGYTAALLPSIFSPLIFPKRSQMAAYTIPQSFGLPLQFTFGVRGFAAGRHPPSEAEDAYGLTTIDGSLIMGSSEAQHASDVDGVQWVGSANDSVVFNRTTEYFRHLPKDIFEGWDTEFIGEGLYRSWTGIQGHTIDTLPYVGAVPSLDGLYVSAGFHGHGMARCLIAARGLVYQLLSPTHEWDRRLPLPFQITLERLNATGTSL